MALEVEATYHDGVLQPDSPLPLGENERVKVTVHSSTPISDRMYGMLQWTGDPEILRRIAEDDDFDDELEAPDQL